MKRTLVIFSAIFVLIACAKEAPIVEEPTQTDNQEIKVNFNISRNDITNDTKSTLKKSFVSGDAIFVFFKGVNSHYLELTYDGTNWSNGVNSTVTIADLNAKAAADDRTMTAVYLPYGSDFTVSGSEGNFTIQKGGENYCGIFYQKTTTYGFDGTTLSATFTMVAPTLDATAHKLVHFDITGYTLEEGVPHTYFLTQDYMKSLTLTSVAAGGEVTKEVSEISYRGLNTAVIPGYYDSVNGIISFSGFLDGTLAVGKSKDYRFVIHDKTNGHAYSRVDIKGKTISNHTYIGLGSISGAGTKWQEITDHYVSVSPTRLVTFAPGNLQYRASSGAWRFAEHQYSFVGGTSYDDPSGTYGDVYVDEVKSDNSLISESYTGWIDLFGWACDGWSGPGDGSYGTNYQPWTVGGSEPQYGPVFVKDDTYGYNLVGKFKNGDWGEYCTIKTYDGSTTYTAGSYWRLPTGGSIAIWNPESGYGEWPYLLSHRNVIYNSLHPGARFVPATINNPSTSSTVYGLIIFPDYYEHPGDVTVSQYAGGYDMYNYEESVAFDVEHPEKVYSTIISSFTDWEKMADKGCVFLPAARFRRYDSGTKKVQYKTAWYGGTYRSSTAYGSSESCLIGYEAGIGFARNPGNNNFRVSNVSLVWRDNGFSVRLIHDLNPTPAE